MNLITDTKATSSKIKTYNILSINKEILSDLDTPVSAFYKVCENKPYSFLLESVEGNEKIGRYSIIGTSPILILRSINNKTLIENKITSQIIELENNPFHALNNLLKEITITSQNKSNYLGFVGYFGYETIRWIEPKIKLTPHINTPDVCLIFPGELLIFDHVMHKVNLISNTIIESQDEITKREGELKNKLESLLSTLNKPRNIKALSLDNTGSPKINYKSNYTNEEFTNMVRKVKEYIVKGDIFQAVISQKLTVKGKYDGLILYRLLRSINPSPYLFYLNLKDFEIAGSSPEVMVKCENTEGKKTATLRPIAGTYPRGKNEMEDKENIAKLLNDPKEKAEHLMLVDLARNDLGKVCKTGSINVNNLMIIEKYSHLLHMVTNIEGLLKKDKTSIDLLCASFPAGTLSGAPKIRAIEIINELEKYHRGPYGGCTGFFGLNDEINTCMTIRTFIVYKDYVEIQVGAGIVADSNAENEYNETLQKGAALIKAISLVMPAPRFF